VEAVWAYWRRDISLAFAQNRPPDRPCRHSLVTILTELFRLYRIGRFLKFLCQPKRSCVVFRLTFSSDGTFNQATTARCRILPNPLFTVAQSFETVRSQLLPASLNNHKYCIFTIIDLRQHAVKKTAVSCDVKTSSLIRPVNYRIAFLAVDITCHRSGQ
jgi:hypothetical protein